jgi:hypothetical protein
MLVQAIMLPANNDDESLESPEKSPWEQWEELEAMEIV